MNIVEAFIKFNKQLIIIITGLSGSGKIELVRNISRDFKLKVISLRDFCKKDYNTKVSLPNGVEVINWDSDDVFDWDLFNKEVEEHKTNGVIVYGNVIPDEKIKFTPNFHLHVKISKQNLIIRRHEFLNKHKDDEDCKESFELINTDTEKLIINQLTYPYYLESMKRQTINKFLNANELNNDAIYDEAFDYVIEKIKENVYKGRKDVNKGEEYKKEDIKEDKKEESYYPKDIEPPLWQQRIEEEESEGTPPIIDFDETV
jgi:adenylate kinase family enzyme